MPTSKSKSPTFCLSCTANWYEKKEDPSVKDEIENVSQFRNVYRPQLAHGVFKIDAIASEKPQFINEC